MNPDLGYFFKIYWFYFTKQNFLLIFSLIFMLTWWTIQKSGNFYNLSFFNLRVRFFLQFLVAILPLGSRSVEPHTFADPGPRSQNLADPTDPDPKLCSFLNLFKRWIFPWGGSVYLRNPRHDTFVTGLYYIG